MKRLFSISHSIWFIQAIFLKPAYILCFDVMVNRTNTGYQSKNVKYTMYQVRFPGFPTRTIVNRPNYPKCEWEAIFQFSKSNLISAGEDAR